MQLIITFGKGDNERRAPYYVSCTPYYVYILYLVVVALEIFFVMYVYIAAEYL